jgi:hypothetical protein
MNMNAPFTPVDSHGDYVTALLTILADPVKTKARLEELVAQEKATQERIDALNEMAVDTRRLNSAAQAANIVSDNRKTALDAREAEIEERTKVLELAESARSEKSLQRREAAVLAREQRATREEERLTALQADCKNKLDKIKNFAGNL